MAFPEALGRPRRGLRIGRPVAYVALAGLLAAVPALVAGHGDHHIARPATTAVPAPARQAQAQVPVPAAAAAPAEAAAAGAVGAVAAAGAVAAVGADKHVPAPAPAAPASSAVALSPTPTGWTSLAVVTGTGDGHSAVFHLRGIDTQLRYVSDSSSLLVYVLDKRRGLDATAGYADVECSGPCRDDHMPLVDGAGDYELVVRATGGSWAVSIEEYRAG